MKNIVFWDVARCASCEDRCFGGTCRLHHQGRIRELGTTSALTNNRNTLPSFLVTAEVVPNSLILVAMIMGATRSSERTVLTIATRGHIPEDGIFLISVVQVLVRPSTSTLILN
jgi:hypothetical protein